MFWAPISQNSSLNNNNVSQIVKFPLLFMFFVHKDLRIIQANPPPLVLLILSVKQKRLFWANSSQFILYNRSLDLICIFRAVMLLYRHNEKGLNVIYVIYDSKIPGHNGSDYMVWSIHILDNHPWGLQMISYYVNDPVARVFWNISACYKLGLRESAQFAQKLGRSRTGPARGGPGMYKFWSLS